MINKFRWHYFILLFDLVIIGIRFITFSVNLRETQVKASSLNSLNGHEMQEVMRAFVSILSRHKSKWTDIVSNKAS